MNHRILRAWIVGIGVALVSAALLLAGGPMRLPPDLLFDSKDAPAPVIFRHTTHVAPEPAQNACLACHPEPYKMLHPVRHATHDEMDHGRSCGACHDGKKAFATSDPDRCDRCHSTEAGS